MPSVSLAVLALLLVQAKPASPPAPTTPRALVVLVDSSPAAPPELRGQLVGALQTEVERSVGFKWVDPPAISVDELALALNCGGMDDACLRGAGDNLKADAVMLVSVGAGGRKEVVISLVHVRPPKPTRLTSIPLADLGATVQEVRNAARSLLGPVKPTRLVVVTDPPGALVSVDGKAVGPAPYSVNDLAQGPHSVAVQLQGYQPQSTKVDLKIGEASEVRLTLQSNKPAPPPAATPAPAPPVAAAPPQPAPPPAARPPAATPAPVPAPLETAAAAPPAWHRAKYFSPVPGAAGLAAGVLGLAAGAVVTAWGANAGSLEEDRLRPDLNSTLKLLNNSVCKKNSAGQMECSTSLFSQRNAVYHQFAVLGLGIAGMVLGAVVVLSGLALLALSPLPMIFLE
ncbi:MAG: PEGA domain-containing protein [Deltaproteobacteria bacterium]|nr:PEGA domain-containing protein [Deltaproteobacteria bacterium]